MHGLLGVPRLIAEPLCLAPSPPSHTRDAARITPLPFVPFNFGVSLTRRFELPLGVFPLLLYNAFEFTLGVKHVKAHRYGLPGDGLGSLARRAWGCIRQLHPAFKPLAPIGDDVLQARPVDEHLAPTLPATVWSPLACHPRHAVRFDRHQHRRAMQEDFVETEHAHAHLPG